jgi:hypothetical protein
VTWIDLRQTTFIVFQQELYSTGPAAATLQGRCVLVERQLSLMGDLRSTTPTPPPLTAAALRAQQWAIPLASCKLTSATSFSVAAAAEYTAQLGATQTGGGGEGIVWTRGVILDHRGDGDAGEFLVDLGEGQQEEGARGGEWMDLKARACLVLADDATDTVFVPVPTTKPSENVERGGQVREVRGADNTVSAAYGGGGGRGGGDRGGGGRDREGCGTVGVVERKEPPAAVFQPPSPPPSHTHSVESTRSGAGGAVSRDWVARTSSDASRDTTSRGGGDHGGGDRDGGRGGKGGSQGWASRAREASPSLSPPPYESKNDSASAFADDGSGQGGHGGLAFDAAKVTALREALSVERSRADAAEVRRGNERHKRYRRNLRAVVLRGLYCTLPMAPTRTLEYAAKAIPHRVGLETEPEPPEHLFPLTHTIYTYAYCFPSLPNRRRRKCTA